MRLAIMVSAILTLASTAAWAQTGVSYRFEVDALVGTVWVSGDNARRELESGEGGAAAGRVEIWKNDGKQIFILNPTDRTSTRFARDEVCTACPSSLSAPAIHSESTCPGIIASESLKSWPRSKDR